MFSSQDPNLEGSLWSQLYGSWIYNYLYLCNQCLSPLMLWVRIPLGRGVLDTTLCDKVSQWLAAGRWFSLGTPVSYTNKTDRHDITEILLKVALNTITLTLIKTWNHIGGVMVSLLPSSAVVHGFKPWSGQTKDYIIAVCCIKTLRAEWLAMVLCFMVFNTTFNNISVILWRLGLFHWWRKPEYPEKTADLS